MTTTSLTTANTDIGAAQDAMRVELYALALTNIKLALRALPADHRAVEYLEHAKASLVRHEASKAAGPLAYARTIVLTELCD